MTYDSGYPNEPVGGSNPYYRCVHCKLTDPQINGDINNHAWHCEYRRQKQGYKLDWADYDDLMDEICREDLQDYTAVVMAYRALSRSDIVGALAHLKIDADKIRMVSPKLYKIIMEQG